MSASRPSRDAAALGGREVTTGRRLRYPRGEARASVPEPPEDKKKAPDGCDPRGPEKNSEKKGLT